MTATLGNAFKNLIEGAHLGVAAYRDGAPDDEEMPYITITERISITSSTVGGDNGAQETVIELVQVDVWERWRDEDELLVESPVLADRVQQVLHGAQLPDAPKRVFSVFAPDSRRLRENNIVHTAITATVHRVL